MADFAELKAEVERNKSVTDSAVAAFAGVADRLDAAVKEAVAANDAADLSAITDFSAQLRSETDALAAAIPANTTPEPPPA